MTFEEILDQAIAMLQRRGRVTYGALKLQFHLDDDQLAVLKDELLYAQQVAREEDGRVLAWTGGAATLLAPPPHSPMHASQPPAQEVALPQTAPRPVTPSPPEAERRQLTVLFCDLVDSTALASQLDPEDLREVVRAYQEVCAQVITRFEGHIAQYLGDGLLVYFGYPRAHEDDAQRAVRSGLAMVQAMATLNRAWGRSRAYAWPSGWASIPAWWWWARWGRRPPGTAGAGGDAESGGPPPGPGGPRYRGDQCGHLPPGAGLFYLPGAGGHSLKGVAAPVQVYRMLGESAAQSRLDVAEASGLTPLVGRESEVALLLERWAQSQDGLGQVVLLSGEAGIGKSRLVEVLRERVAQRGRHAHGVSLFPLHQQERPLPRDRASAAVLALGQR